MNKLSFNDLFKKSFLKLVPETMDAGTLVITLAISLLIGMAIYGVYRKCFIGVVYDHTFNVSLVVMTVLVAVIIVTISTNVTLSLGMVGALSIVRFRTAVKDPLDTAYMFWAITMGILIGANAYIIALIAVLGISIIMLVLSFLRFRNPDGYLLVLHYDEYAQADIENELRRSIRSFRMRSKTVTRAGAEMTVEVRMDQRGDLVGHMLDIEGVHDATLVACQTEAGA